MDSTLDAKLDYERKLSTFGVNIAGYHADNGRFADAAWKDSCQALNQKIQFCGVGSHHQNGIVERRIRDLSDAARASLLHAIHHWPEGVSKNLWPFALKHACNIRNRVRSVLGKTPEEILSGVSSSFTSDISQYHPFGCPAFVLDARLQGSLKIPRWEPRSRVGVYLGHSPHHANNVALILNLSTGHVSPQYHVVYDDTFSTVASIRVDSIPSNWSTLCSESCELITDENFALSPEWDVPASSPASVQWLESHLDSAPTLVQDVFPDAPVVPQNEGEHEGASVAEGVSQNEGDHEENVMIDPFSGRLQEFSDHLEPNSRRSERVRKPTKRLIEDSLFGCPALTHN
jgi:hypothetical protein